MTPNALGRYQQVDQLTMHPGNRVVFLYSQILANLRQAQVLLDAGRFEDRAQRLGKAQEIIHELLVSLDFEAGGQIATSLAALYDYWLREIPVITARNDRARLERLVTMVSELHGAWAQAAAQVVGGQPLPSSA